MTICDICKKKIKFLDQYSEEGIEGSFCKDCFKDKGKLKTYTEKQEKKEKEEQEKERLEEKLEDKKIKQEVKKNTPFGVYEIIFLLYFAFVITLFFGLSNLYQSNDVTEITYKKFEGGYKRVEKISDVDVKSTITFQIVLLIFLITYIFYLIYLVHKRKRKFINLFLGYLWLISFSNVIMTGVYRYFIIAIFFTVYLKSSKKMNYAFYN